MRFICWNVNGIRAAAKKGFHDYLEAQEPDFLCIQETKAHPEQLDETLLTPDGYYTYWHLGEKRGYSGVSIFTKHRPLEVKRGQEILEMDTEGRILRAEYERFFLYSIYFPNGQRGDDRLQYKLEFYDRILEHFEETRKTGKPLIICGDVNTAHNEIDIARPKENENTSGFMRIERDWVDKFVEHGYIDTFRHLHPDATDMYSWWTFRANARARNIGWRIDYFFVTPDLEKHIKSADIQMDVMGSDHAPITLELDIAID